MECCSIPSAVCRQPHASLYFFTHLPMGLPPPRSQKPSAACTAGGMHAAKHGHGATSGTLTRPSLRGSAGTRIHRGWRRARVWRGRAYHTTKLRSGTRCYHQVSTTRQRCRLLLFTAPRCHSCWTTAMRGGYCYGIRVRREMLQGSHHWGVLVVVEEKLELTIGRSCGEIELLRYLLYQSTPPCSTHAYLV